MTMPELVVVIVGGSLFASGMIVSAVTAVYPKWLMITAPVICRRLEHMELHIGRASYHRPGERGLTITCVGSERRTVTLRAFFLPWMMLAAVMMIVGAVSVLIIKAL